MDQRALPLRDPGLDVLQRHAICSGRLTVAAQGHAHHRVGGVLPRWDGEVVAGIAEVTEPVEESINLVPLRRTEVDIANLSGLADGAVDLGEALAKLIEIRIRVERCTTIDADGDLGTVDAMSTQLRSEHRRVGIGEERGDDVHSGGIHPDVS